jgi:hypothetical protein
VILPKELAKSIPKGRLLEESEWRQLGVQQSRGWKHYAIHRCVRRIRTRRSRGVGVIGRRRRGGSRHGQTHARGRGRSCARGRVRGHPARGGDPQTVLTPSLSTDPSLPSTVPACPLPCRPEPHILLFRRELGTNPNTGKVDPVLRQQQVDAYNREYAGK